MARIIIGTLLVLWGLSSFLGFSLFRFFFAIVIIMLGVHVLAGRRGWYRSSATESSSDEYVNEVVVMSALDKAVKSENFKGGKVVLVFAGGEIDLRGAKAQSKEITLEITSVFGGCKVMVPQGWKVKVQGTAIVGGYDNRTASAEGGTVLIIRGSAVFGGVEIVN